MTCTIWIKTFVWMKSIESSIQPTDSTELYKHMKTPLDKILWEVKMLMRTSCALAAPGQSRVRRWPGGAPSGGIIAVSTPHPLLGKADLTPTPGKLVCQVTPSSRLVTPDPLFCHGEIGKDIWTALHNVVLENQWNFANQFISFETKLHPQGPLSLRCRWLRLKPVNLMSPPAYPRCFAATSILQPMLLKELLRK